MLSFNNVHSVNNILRITFVLNANLKILISLKIREMILEKEIVRIANKNYYILNAQHVKLVFATLVI